MKAVSTTVAYGSSDFDRAVRGLRLATAQSTLLVLAGLSGTGKTQAAEGIAKQLGKPLFRIDLNAVVSKHFGETEKHLERLFKEAEASGGVLFFDEGDALFDARTGVKDSTDRYANLDTTYLLQRIEKYRGIMILATNAAPDIDTAHSRWRERQIIVTVP